MFCYQCEQTAKGTGCTAWGVCGKSPEVADLQDVLLYVTKGVSMYAARARRLGGKDAGIDRFVVEALFTTITNVNFDEERMETMIRRAGAVRSEAKKLYEDACAKAGKIPEVLGGPAAFALAPDRNGLIRQGGEVNPEAFAEKRGEVVQGLHDLVLLGLKGSAAYADHAAVLGHVDDDVMGFFHDSSISSVPRRSRWRNSPERPSKRASGTSGSWSSSTVRTRKPTAIPNQRACG
jgi:hydroxylamine reductase